MSEKKRKYKQYLYKEDINVSKKTKRRWSKPSQSSGSESCSGSRNNCVENSNEQENEIFNVEELTVNNNDADTLCKDGENNTSNHVSDRTTDNFEPNSENDFNDEILFPASGCTQQDILTMVFVLTLKHKLTKAAQKDILQLIKVLGDLSDDSFSTSNYSLQKQFDGHSESLNYVFYCQNCKSKLQEPTKQQQIKPRDVICPNVKCCLKQKISSTSENILISIDLVPQLKSLLQNHTSELRTTKVKENEYISDVHDGNIYKNLVKSQLNFNLTLTFSTDGAPVFSSSKLSMWPIQCIINELPPQIRFKRLLLAGIWVGQGEPDVHLMNTFMQTFTSQMKLLFETGITIDIKSDSITFTFLPVLCCCDSVARPVLQGRVQFNGYFGCSWCYQKGEAVGKQVKYPYSQCVNLRTKQSHMNDLREASNRDFNEKIHGVKGPSALVINLPYFDPVWGFPIDYMHGIILGVVRQLWELWTTYTPENKYTYYIGKPSSLKIINQRLMAIMPPHEIERLPRSLNVKAKWKASEWRSWLLFYALPCLKDVLQETYLVHFSLLVTSVFCLLQEKISMCDLGKCEIRLRKFVTEFEQYYGKHSMTFNVHSLLHLTENVKQSGPLWATSTFAFESGIYRIKQQIKGPVGVAKQIANKMYQINTFFGELSNKKLSQNCQKFSQSVWYPIKNYLPKQDTIFLGSALLIAKDELLYYFSFSDFHLNPQFHGDAFSYKRCIYKQILIHSLNYRNAKKNNDTIVQLDTSEFIEIQTLFSYDSKTYMFVKKLSVKKLKIGNIKVKHIFKLSKNEQDFEFVLLPIEHIKQKCILVEHDNNQYVCSFPNLIEQ